MKISFTTILIIALLAGACKKTKEAEVMEPTPPAKTISVKVDGTLKECSSACYSGSTSGGLRGLYFYFAGFDEYIYFSCTNLPALGTYTLVKYKDPYLMYSKTNSNRPATSGVINITAIDTSSNGVLNKLAATFSFKTDTSSSGSFYNLTEGVINLKN
jgi:hypothetical protein